MNLLIPLLLASASPRRRLLLEQAGVDVIVRPPAIDDGQLRQGAVSAEQWVMALAYLKARWLAEQRENEAATNDRLILAADTVCVHRGEVLGQPRDAEHARWMLIQMRNAAHRTITGVCLLSRNECSARRVLFFDEATVSIGQLADEAIDAYIASGRWQGKAGGYNLAEQIAAGWPIQCSGDPATVMGLPMRRLLPMLRGSAVQVQPATRFGGAAQP